MTTPHAATMDWKLVLEIVQFALYCILGIWLWITNKNKVTNSRISDFQKDVDERFDDQNTRLVTVETKLQNANTPERIGKVHKRLDDLQQSVATQAGEMKGMNKTLDLIHQSLLEKDK